MNELLSRQHFHSKAQALSPDHDYCDLGLEAENTVEADQTAGIDLVNEPHEWISGFDAGFNNRPLVSGNTQQYCDGYLHGQHAWQDPAASPSLSLATSELSSFGSLDADTIDPHLLDLDASNDDDLFKTPMQLTIANCSVDLQKLLVIASAITHFRSPRAGCLEAIYNYRDHLHNVPRKPSQMERTSWNADLDILISIPAGLMIIHSARQRVPSMNHLHQHHHGRPSTPKKPHTHARLQLRERQVRHLSLLMHMGT